MLARKGKGRMRGKKAELSALFKAEAAYSESIFREALGDTEGSLEFIETALRHKPDYAPALLSKGSVEYQLDRQAEGKRYFHSLLELPDDTEDLCEIISKAGDFLMHMREYGDGLELFRAAARRFPDVADFHQGVGCCASHEGLIDEALAANRRAVELNPDSSELVNDLGWTLFVAGRYQEAEAMLEQALTLEPVEELAYRNLEICREKLAQQQSKQSKRKRS